MREQSFEGADGLRLFYRRAGNPGGGTVVMLHGGPGMDGAYLVPDLAPLQKRHELIFYDQRGGGRSELPVDTTLLTMQRHVEDLERLRLHFGLERLTLLGHSWGSLLAAAYAIEYPQRVERMILIGPLPPRRGDVWDRHRAAVAARLSPEELERMGRLRGELLHGPDPAAACRKFWEIALRPRFADPARVVDLKGDLCTSPAETIRYGMAKTNPLTLASIGDWDLRAELAKVAAPTLVIHGEAETIPMDLAEEWTASLPNASLLRVPDAGHFPYVEQPEVVWPAIEAFLGR